MLVDMAATAALAPPDYTNFCTYVNTFAAAHRRHHVITTSYNNIIQQVITTRCAIQTVALHVM